MKYDEKTGKKVPESRVDEIKISLDLLAERMKKSDGIFDRHVEIAWILRDISISLALLVDMMGLMMHRLIDKATDHEEGTDWGAPQ